MAFLDEVTFSRAVARGGVSIRVPTAQALSTGL